MRKKNILLLSAAAMVSAVLGTVVPSALGQATGPFTQAQVDTGRQAYADNCAACHQADMAGTNDAPALAGSAFIGAWKGRTTEALYSKISKTMPAGRGGSLDEATYTSIVAYILRANGATPGSTAFAPATAPVAIGSIAHGEKPAGPHTPPAAPNPSTARNPPPKPPGPA